MFKISAPNRAGEMSQADTRLGIENNSLSRTGVEKQTVLEGNFRGSAKATKHMIFLT